MGVLLLAAEGCLWNTGVVVVQEVESGPEEFLGTTCESSTGVHDAYAHGTWQKCGILETVVLVVVIGFLEI